MLANWPVLTRVNKTEVWEHLRQAMDREPSARDLERRRFATELYPHVKRFYRGWQVEGGPPHYRYNEVG